MSNHDVHDVHALLRSSDLIEALASAEHQRWSDWQRHLHDQCAPGPAGSLIIPGDLVRRWTTQLNTPYAELTEKEKNSDREQVQRYLPIIGAALEDGRSSSYQPGPGQLEDKDHHDSPGYHPGEPGKAD